VRGLVLRGVDVIDVGISPTDKVALLTKEKNATIGIMVTASHHSYKRNGFKFLYREGNGFLNEDMNKIKRIFESIKNSDTRVEERDKGMVTNIEKEANEIYMERAKKALKEYLGEGVDKVKRVKVIVDACNGGAFLLSRKLFEEFGFEIVPYNCSPVINHEIHPEPMEETRKHLKEIMVKENANLVVGYDPDADRVFLMTRKHEWVDGDEIFVLLAKIIKARNIVASLDTSMMLEMNTNAKVTYTRVGDIFVAKKALEIKADFLGEPNGHYAFPLFSIYNSGVFASLILAHKCVDIDEMLDNLKRTEKRNLVLKLNGEEEKIERMDTIKDAIKRLEEKSNVSIISEEDGIKFKMNESVCLIRPSGTKNVIRVFIESANKSDLERDFKILGDVLYESS